MKALISLVVIAFISFLAYALAKKMDKNKTSRKPVFMTIIITAGLCILLVFIIVKTNAAQDMQCRRPHVATTQFPENLVTAQDYFAAGNYFYDVGDCNQAVKEYTKALEKNPSFPQALNNRAYTNMRLRNYKDALSDLNRAIELNPNYVQALMNRGDIYNYYYAIDRTKAIADYNKVLVIGREKDVSRSVCGHKAMAETNNMIPLVLLKFILNRGNC